MKKKTLVGIVATIIVIIVVAIVAFNSFFIILPGEQVVVTQFGAIKRAHTEPGLKWKVPFIQTVHKYSKKLISWDGFPKEIQTIENQNVWIDITARWYIKDVVAFHKNFKTFNSASEFLDQNLTDSMQKIIGNNSMVNAIRSTNLLLTSDQIERFSEDNEQLMTLLSNLSFEKPVSIDKGRDDLANQIVTGTVNQLEAEGLGLVDVKIRRVLLPQKLWETFAQKMISERQKISNIYRGFGQAQYDKRRGETKQEVDTKTSDGYRQSEEIKGNADEEAAAIYRSAYSQDADFAEFFQNLESLRKTLLDKKMTLTTDIDYFDYFNRQDGR